MLPLTALRGQARTSAAIHRVVRRLPGPYLGPGLRPRMSGDLANGGETVVADHVVSHVWEHTYLLWFEDQLTPHLRPSKPPAAAESQSGEMGDWRAGSVVMGRQGVAR